MWICGKLGSYEELAASFGPFAAQERSQLVAQSSPLDQADNEKGDEQNPQHQFSFILPVSVFCFHKTAL